MRALRSRGAVVSGLSRGMPADRKEAVLFAADNADDIRVMFGAIRTYELEGHKDMAGWVASAYLLLCAVNWTFHESRWQS